MQHQVRRFAPWCSLAGILLLAGCRPSFSECEAAWTRFEGAALNKVEGPRRDATKAFLDAQKDGFVKTCHERGDRDEVACVRRAETLEAVEKCAAH